MCVRVYVSESDHSGLRARGRHQVSWVRARDHGEMKRPGRVGWEDELWLVGRGGKKNIPKQSEFALEQEVCG